MGENRPQVPRRAPDPQHPVSREQRQAEKEQVAAERRAIKKSARRHLKQQLEEDLENLAG